MTDFLPNAIDFFRETVLKFILKLPPSPFDFTAYISALDGYLGNINYFIPFYLFKDILAAWVAVVFVCLEILIMVRWLKNSVFSK